jgi:flagellar motor switch protein FliM
MEKVLNQQEIDNMVRAARGGGAVSSEPALTRWDYRQAGRIGREQLESISALHEGFARSLTNSLGAYLRIGFQVGLVSAEHLTYREFLSGVPERSYLGSCKLAPFGASALIQMDLAVAFPLIDVLLGGEGIGQPPSREITEIEEQIVETVMRIICRELQTAWTPLALEFQFDQRQHPARLQHLMPIDERTLGLSFEISMKDCRGLMSLAIPAAVSSALLRKLTAGHSHAHANASSPVSAEHIRQRLLRCSFRLELELQVAASSAGELAALAPGTVLALKRRADGVAQLVAGERTIFQARVSRVGDLLAAHVLGEVEENNPWGENQ